jgi:hypothetical protein
MTHGGGKSASINRVKPLKSNGSAFWAVFYHQFEATTLHPVRKPYMCSNKLLTYYSVPAKATKKDINRILKDCYKEHRLAMAYWSQLKARI